MLAVWAEGKRLIIFVGANRLAVEAADCFRVQASSLKTNINPILAQGPRTRWRAGPGRDKRTRPRRLPGVFF